MARRRSNPLVNYALLNDYLARERENDRREYYEGHNAEPVEEYSYGYKVYPASELGLLRRALDSSRSKEQREEDAIWASSKERAMVDLDFFRNDLIDHLNVIKYTISTYVRNPLLAVLTVLMLAGHAAMLIAMLGSAAAENNGAPFGGSFLTSVVSGWTIYNVVALTLLALSPLLLTSLHKGFLTVVGGKSHRFVQFLIATAAVPAIFSGSALFLGGGSGVHPVVIAAFFAHALLPLVIRKLASMSIRGQIRKLSFKVQSMATAVEEDENSAYLTSLLERKVIGTPGASLGTSDFSADQVAAGVAGERKTAKVLDDFARAHDNAIVFHSVRWNMSGAPYDIDHVVVLGQRVFFLDSKNWSTGNYSMLPTGDTVLKDGAAIPNGSIHVQKGADTYINAFGIDNYLTQVVVWTDGTLSNQGMNGARLVKSDEMLDWLNHNARESDAANEGYNVPLLKSLEAHTAS